MQLSILLILSLPLAGSWWVGREELTFEEARSACSPGDLATFSTNQELSELLRTNQELQLAFGPNKAFFWVGLEKPKDLCVVPGLDQRGFRFVDGRQDSELSIWKEEPKDTCTNGRCGAVALDSGSWGLVSLSCKSKNHFICGPPESGPRSETSPPSRPETKPESRPESEVGSQPETGLESQPEQPAGTREPNHEQTRLIPGFEPDPGLRPESSDYELTSEPAQKGPTFAPEFVPFPDREPSADQSPSQDPNQHLSLDKTSSSAQVPDKTPAHAAPSPGPGHNLSPQNGSGPASRPSCSLPVIPGSRSLSLDDSEPGQVSVECWSGEVLLLLCDHGVWIRTEPDSEPGPEPSPDPTVISGAALNQSEDVSCSDCGPGFREGHEGGECVDIDECSLSPAPCAHGCVNARGSFSCSPAPLSNALVHSLIAVAAVLLAVVAVVTIWCCIRRKMRRDEKPEPDLNQNQSDV